MATITLPQYLKYNTPAICVQFDDGLTSLYSEAFSYMNALGMKGTGYIISGVVGTGGYVTEANLSEMDAASWDMANHTDSGTNLPTLTEAEQETALSTCKSYLDGLGLTRASAHVTYPTGAWNADTLTAMTNQSMLTGKSRGTNIESFRYIAANPYIIPVYPPQASTSPTSVIGWIKACQCSKSVGTVVFHDIVESGATGNQYNRADFRTVIDYIYAQKIIVLTISQLYSLMSGSIEYTNYWE